MTDEIEFCVYAEKLFVTSREFRSTSVEPELHRMLPTENIISEILVLFECALWNSFRFIRVEKLV